MRPDWGEPAFGTAATTKNWNDSTGTGTPTAFASASTAVFGGTPGTVTISNSSPATVTVSGGLQFDITGYTITGDTLNLGTISKIKVSNAADTATIAAKISGTSGLTKTGDGDTGAVSSASSDFSGKRISEWRHTLDFVGRKPWRNIEFNCIWQRHAQEHVCRRLATER